ncbi:MAG: tetratricopeptide repeat protein [Lentimicrobiaceae bacterium]|nr:tetratricopeptide repeat protein [Lentimicrobiaceae bacterium]
MKIKTSFLSLLFFIILCNTGKVFSQNTASELQPYADYRLAKEMFSVQKFGAAQALFENVMQSIPDKEDAIRIDAEYYAAFCALELLHPDAEYRMIEFITYHPDNNNTKVAYFQLGKFYYSQKDFQKAVAAFEKTDIFELNNRDLAEYYFKLGLSYFKRNDFEKALKNFYEIKDSENQYSAPALYYYSHISYLNKNYETALSGFNKLKTNETFKNMVPLYIAQIHYIKGEYDALLQVAIPLLENEKTKKIFDLARLVGESYYKTGKYAESIPYLELYSDRTTRQVSRPEFYQLAFAYYKTANYPKAIPFFQEIAKDEDSLTQNSLYLLADCYIKTGEKQFARNTFASFLKMDFYPELRENALYNYAKLSYELSKNPLNDAINSIKLFISEFPKSQFADEMYTYLVNLFLSSNNYKDAFASLENIKVKDDRLKEAYQNITFNRGVELYNDNKFEEAVAMFKKSLTYNLNKGLTASARYWLGESYYRLSDFEQALSNYRSFMLLPSAYQSKYYNLANYNIAYIQLNKKNYKEALTGFRKFLVAKSKEEPTVIADAQLRTADCYFANKQYLEAIEYYDKALNSSANDADYALYQKALAYGAQGKLNPKSAALSELIKKYKKSAYYDDALYELGVTSLVQNNNEQAMIYFKRIISETPRSNFAIKAKLKNGMIYYNNEQNDLALQTLRNLVDTYPNTPEAREALVTIKNIYIDMNRVDDYFAFAKNIPFANISMAEEDSASYIAAENLYMKGDCNSSVTEFGNYLSKFPNGAFIVNAAFYKAECLYNNNKKNEALTGYSLVVSQPANRFTESSWSKIAEIQYSDKKYSDALIAFKRLYESAEQNNIRTEATAGQMRCYYRLSNYDSVMITADKLLSAEKISASLQSETQLLIAHSAYALKDMGKATRSFENTLQLSQGERGAEANYYLAKIAFEQQKYQEAEKKVFALSENFTSYDFWVASGFILLGDIYVQTGNLFQAKQTLQSIIDNYEGEDLKSIAKEKLNAIISSEKPTINN